MVYLLLHVDDKIIASKSKSEIQVVRAKLQKEFEIKELENARRILGMEIERDRKNETLFLSQKSYIQKILQRFNIFDSRPVLTSIASPFKLSSTQSPQIEGERKFMQRVPYFSAISLMYSIVCSRPDLAYAVRMVSRFMSYPGKQHWEVFKWVLKYLKGSQNVGFDV